MITAVDQSIVIISSDRSVSIIITNSGQYPICQKKSLHIPPESNEFLSKSVHVITNTVPCISTIIMVHNYFKTINLGQFWPFSSLQIIWEDHFSEQYQ